MGPVDDPHEPPCVRCRRESKECHFSATRRKRKSNSGEDAAAVEDEYTLRNHRKKIPRIPDPLDAPQTRVWHSQTSAASRSSSPASPTGAYGWDGQERAHQPRTYVPETEQDLAITPGEQEVTNETAAALFQSPINNPGDALHLLLEASGRTGDLHRQASAKGEADKTGSSKEPVPGLSNVDGDFHRPRSLTRPSDPKDYLSNIDPSITNNAASGDEPGSVLSLYRKALKMWSSLRFVRAGWFTAVEAMSYID